MNTGCTLDFYSMREQVALAICRANVFDAMPDATSREHWKEIRNCWRSYLIDADAALECVNRWCTLQQADTFNTQRVNRIVAIRDALSTQHTTQENEK